MIKQRYVAPAAGDSVAAAAAAAAARAHDGDDAQGEQQQKGEGAVAHGDREYAPTGRSDSDRVAVPKCLDPRSAL